ncbi:hypothetical protein A7U60_g9127 [Sanghuangporus baumii]|uniref:Uncharacterized protein n=1 Tax=Sanghuangporus baumii TaxID=108892 RepID=A0A9Q5HQ40_SANBA|nr:hypothetical protein A7U60_g9127 [Sanghuangporus baumii]
MSVQPITFIETFSGRDGETVEGWIEDVDSVFWLMQIPEEKRVPLVVEQCLSCGVLECLLSVIISVEKISGRRWEWDWSKMKVALRGIERQIKANKPSGNGGSWMKALTFGAIVAVGGPLGLGWALTETAICTLAVVAWNKVDTTDVKAEAIASEVGKGGGWLRALTLGAMIAIGGPLALGMALTETMICTIGAILLNIRLDNSDSKARAIAAEVGKSKLSPVAHESIRQIWWKTPSKSWEDGLKFNPSMELIVELLKMMTPEKNTM